MRLPHWWLYTDGMEMSQRDGLPGHYHMYQQALTDHLWSTGAYL